MANARLIYKKISVSESVNSLSLPARLLFSWLIPHADDEGKLKGNPVFIKAQVVPMANWSLKRVEGYLNEIKEAGLIHLWTQNRERYIQFAKWNEYQHIRKDRFTPSSLPSFQGIDDNQPSTVPQPDDNQESPEIKVSESKLNKVKKSEYKEEVADKNLASERGFAASNAWKRLEPNNPDAIKTTYFWALRKGLPSHLFYEYASQIEQDKTVKNRGAVFQAKVKEWLKKKEGSNDV